MHRSTATARGGRKPPARSGQPRAVAEVLQQYLRSTGMQQVFEDYRVIEAWAEIAGAQLAGDTRPIRIEKGVLWIGVKNAPLANQLQYLKPAMLDRIRKLIPGARIRDIRFLHRPEDARR